MGFTLAELAEKLNVVLNDKTFADVIITASAPVQTATAEDISFVANPKYKKYLESTHAAAVILSPALAEDYHAAALVCDNPYAVYARAASLLSPAYMPAAEIHKTAIIDPNANIEPGCYIGPHVVIESGVSIAKNCYIAAGVSIGRDVQVGEATRINANVSIYNACIVGKRNIIHANAVIGADGFGFAHDQGRWIKIPQTGIVVLGDDVEVGASTTIDRGAIENTMIEEGVKLDNQIQIAHNVKIGAHTAIAGCTGIAGSTTIGKHCTIAGMCTIVGHITLADNVHITAMSLISKSIKVAGSYSSGTGFEETSSWRKNSVRFKQLDNISRRLQKLEKKL